MMEGDEGPEGRPEGVASAFMMAAHDGRGRRTPHAPRRPSESFPSFAPYRLQSSCVRMKDRPAPVAGRGRPPMMRRWGTLGGRSHDAAMETTAEPRGAPFHDGGDP